MSIKEQLLMLLENNKGIFLSGEKISEELSVSRTAIWKAINSLRNDGYKISAIKNKGYCLLKNNDILSVQGIQKYLKHSNLDIEVYPVLDSTNNVAKEKAALGVAEGHVIIANEQTNGRGRNGRAFFSPSSTGVYMSIVLRPSFQEAVKLTTMAAVAVCEAIEAVSNERAEIKWVNDVYVKGKKVCGILTEVSLGLEDHSLEYAIIGIGVNVFKPDGGFPSDLENIAGFLFEEEKSDAKNQIAAQILNRFMDYYSSLSSVDYIEQYRRRNFVIGKEVMVHSSKDQRKALAFGIDDDFHLLVEYDDGTRTALSSGEISIRGVY